MRTHVGTETPHFSVNDKKSIERDWCPPHVHTRSVNSHLPRRRTRRRARTAGQSANSKHRQPTPAPPSLHTPHSLTPYLNMARLYMAAHVLASVLVWFIPLKNLRLSDDGYSTVDMSALTKVSLLIDLKPWSVSCYELVCFCFWLHVNYEKNNPESMSGSGARCGILVCRLMY